MKEIFDFLKGQGVKASQSFTPNHSIFWGSYEIRHQPVAGASTSLHLFRDDRYIRGFETPEQAIDYLWDYIQLK